ncbi:MAG TPA: ABC transporter substrate-binding protein, partial [Lachnoclostridium sp.]|nr:ABC transporter substrate-binding protein [Lachnoclostridium sp.]
LITYSGGAVAQNSKTMTGNMLNDLGCKNIADENQSLLKEFNMESIVKEDPDYIFVIPMGNDDTLAMKNLKESIEKNPAWNGLTAVKNNRYILLPKEKFLYKPNEKWAESYQYLSEILYGKK